jgi:hypothetical protein
VLALLAPTLSVEQGAGSWAPWAATAGAGVAAVLFVLRERSARHPLLDPKLVAHPLVSSGLAVKAAAGMATAALGYMVTLQLQLDWGWSPALAAIGGARRLGFRPWAAGEQRGCRGPAPGRPSARRLGERRAVPPT